MKYLLFFYAVFLCIVVLFSALFIDTNLFYLKLLYSGFATGNRLAVTVSYIGIVIIFFVFYFIFLFLAEKEKLAPQLFKKIILLQVVILIFSYPAALSYDIFNYILSAKVLYFYRENPYIVMPIELLGEPNLAFTHATNKIALYGPFWMILTSMPYVLSLGNFFLAIINFKLLITGFYLLTIYFLWNLTKSIKIISFFALNPLVVIETLVSGHNDIVMMSFALGSFVFLFGKKYITSIFFVILSILIKYATLFLIPSFIYIVYKKLIGQKIERRSVYLLSALSMLVIFLLSSLREEIYPWYAIWIITFASLLSYNRFIRIMAYTFTFGLMMRYVPFMLLGSHFGITPLLKIIVTFCLPPLLILVFFMTQKLWKKNITI